MQKFIGDAVTQVLNGLIKTGPANDIDLLLTGHSAGGAIAQMFYAMITSPDHSMANLLPRVRHLHCIVFGAPPIATTPIPKPTSSTGLFLNVVNEGDSVSLIQPEYVNVLLKFFTLSPADLGSYLAKNYPNGFPLPNPVSRVSGSCIVLRDKDTENVDIVCYDAVTIQADKLERKLFGNPVLHEKKVYLERIRSLAKQAV
ncbi:Tripartite motif-containing protein 51 [Madurella mycetomatis]|uniref:Tripartite motif-containing protein 51 n=1 Tax=Madurella mycetomatis TaxID=100816 RepID=A0A175W833_9PEZI|nr:Tripartite motif-containing protein 51 [Madurella mycetomatis]